MDFEGSKARATFWETIWTSWRPQRNPGEVCGQFKAWMAIWSRFGPISGWFRAVFGPKTMDFEGSKARATFWWTSTSGWRGQKHPVSFWGQSELWIAIWSRFGPILGWFWTENQTKPPQIVLYKLTYHIPTYFHPFWAVLNLFSLNQHFWLRSFTESIIVPGPNVK